MRFLSISANEWSVAKEKLASQPDGTKWQRKENKLNHSFIKIDNEIYCIANKKDRSLSQGVEGSVKYAQNERGDTFIIKTPSRNTTKKTAEDTAKDKER